VAPRGNNAAVRLKVALDKAAQALAGNPSGGLQVSYSAWQDTGLRHSSGGMAMKYEHLRFPKGFHVGVRNRRSQAAQMVLAPG